MRQRIWRMSALFAVMSCASMLTPVAAMAADNAPAKLVAKLAAITADNTPTKNNALSVFQVYELPDDGKAVFDAFAADADVIAPVLAFYPDPVRDVYKLGPATATATITSGRRGGAIGLVEDGGSAFNGFSGYDTVITVDFRNESITVTRRCRGERCRR